MNVDPERFPLLAAGARAISSAVVGRIRFWSGADRRSGRTLPHPEFHQVVAFADVELVGDPTNPPAASAWSPST